RCVVWTPPTPKKGGGRQSDPPKSEPIPAGEHPEAIAAASPPLEPPAVLVRSHGLFVRPNTAFSLRISMQNSETFVFPSTIAPAALSLETDKASSAGTLCSSNLVPATVLMPAVLMESLIDTGTPCN